MNYFKYLGTAFSIAQALAEAEAQFASGQPVTVPGIKTYIPVGGGKNAHVEVDISIKPLA